MNKSIYKSASFALGTVGMAVALIIMPEESFEASIRGLDMWLEIVFPSLLPFFIVSEMLIAFGVVRFLGVLLEPLMRPLFKVPGVGGFVWAMGLASGNPSGAKLTARLRQDGQLTRIEAERLVSFTSSANPLFIFGAVSVGFFVNSKLGILLALAHYLGNICVGLVMRFYGRREEKNTRLSRNTTGFSLHNALKLMHQTRLQDKRSLGKKLGDAVNSSIHTLLMIGGFIIIFSVINKLLFLMQITKFLSVMINGLFYFLHLSPALSIPFVSGLFEITLGSQLASHAKDTLLLDQAIITSCMLAFSGFSIQAQVASILAETDIRFKPFFIARILHTLFAGIITWLLFNPVYLGLDGKINPSDVGPVSQMTIISNHSSEWMNYLSHYGPMLTILTLIIYTLLLFGNLKKTRSG